MWRPIPGDWAQKWALCPIADFASSSVAGTQAMARAANQLQQAPVTHARAREDSPGELPDRQGGQLATVARCADDAATLKNRT